MCQEIKRWIWKRINTDQNRKIDPLVYLEITFDEQKLKDLIEANMWPQITWAEYQTILSDIKNIWINSSPARIISDQNKDNEPLTFEDDPDSNWQTYKRKLAADNWNSYDIASLANSVVDILGKLRKETNIGDPVKGLVVGQVQSGKTANFAGLMALAADNSWNIFIILSGVIENLRSQTQTRLLDDLMDNPKMHWVPLPKIPQFQYKQEYSPERLMLDDNDNRRYVTVCLKNSKRLEKLKKWLWYNREVTKKMRIIIIDDEADQASINTLLAKEKG
ncbi:MAG: hypothetical protein NTY74_14715 [Ignavibacteriae bacterium]|nr:hypothetical protein [Ignavibacteriota bacterium]